MKALRCGGVVRRSLLGLLAVLGALMLVPVALGGSLSGSVVLDAAPAVDLSSAGAIDWAIWGYAGGGTSTSLTPDVRKGGGTAIGALTNIDPAPTAPLRGIGQFDGPFAFSWTGGTPTGSADGVRAGLQHNGGPPPIPLGVDVSTLGKGFSFDVPAGTSLRTLRVYVATNRAAGTLTASLSDGSAPDYVNTLPVATDIRSGVYTLTYRASSSGQTLHVSWVETTDNCPTFRCDNAAIYAAALSFPIVVNTSADHIDDGCDLTECTLREAIDAANSAGGGTIAFAIPSDGPATITTTLAPLPPITAPVEIDGTTQPGSTGTVGVSINGGSIGGDGLVLAPGSDGSTIRGLGIQRFRRVIIEGPPGPTFAGIRVQSNGGTIAQNFVGTTYDGLESSANDEGIVVTGSGNTISGNLVSGNSGYGILIDGSAGAHDNLVSANLVGTNATGNASLPNDIGIGTINGALHTVIGGASPADGNVVDGSTYGIDIQGIAGAPDNSEIRFNNVGVGKDGSTTLSGSGAWSVGVKNADGVIIADNVVGNGESGLALANSSGLIVVRNFIGVDRDGDAQGNNNEGIDVQQTDGKRPQNVLVSDNTVRFNGSEGIIISNADRTTVTGNLVTDNGEGVSVRGDHNTIGPGNSVHDNFFSDTGVAVYTGVGNRITQNSIYGNQGLGIDLVPDGSGVTPNDAGDADTGPNDLQNFPVLTSASADGASLDVAYTLDSKPNTAYTIEFFAQTGCDGSTYGEGVTYLGSRQVKLGAGVGTFSATLTSPDVADLNSDQSITATATDSNGSTSEFSACVSVTTAATLTGLRLTSDDPAVPAGASNVPLNSVPPALLGSFAFSPIPNSPIPNSAVGSAPIPNSPIPNSPIPNSPIPNSPIPNSPIPNSGLDGIPAALLANVLLSSIPIDWNAIFVAPDTNAGVPLTSLTLADLYRDSAALEKFNRLKLGQLQLQTTLLRGARFVSFLFGATKLKWIPPYGQSAWCAAVGKPAGCSDLDVTTTTVLGLDVAGLLDDSQIARLGLLTVGDITDPGPPVTPIPNSPIPNSPIPNSPIPNSPIPNSPIPNSSLSLTAIGSIVVGDLYNPPAVVDCTRFTSNAVCLTKTLSEASAAGAMKSTATFADLAFPKIGSTVSPLARINFNAFSVGLIGLENLPWESWPFAGFQQFAGTGDVVHYHLTAPVPCGTPYKLRAILPNGFLVKAGTSALAIGVGAAKATGDPAQDADGATWSLLPVSGCAPVEGSKQTVRLDFQGLAGFRLGEQTSIVRLIVGSSTSAATGQAPVTVTQTNEPDGDPATAPAIQPNTLAIGHIGTSGDLDWRSLSTTGMVPGTKIQVFMRPPAGTDLDVFLTKPSSQSLLSSPIPNSPIPNSPIPNSALPDNGNSLNTPTDNPQPEGLQDAPIPNSTIASSGHTRGDGVEVAQVTLAGDENGPVKIVVDGYNGDFSNDAYTLRVKVITPPQLPACPARTFPFPPGTVGTLPASIPADTTSLMLFNYSATASMYGQTAATALRDRLNAFVTAHPALKIAVLQVDGDAAVRAAKTAWDASPCAINAANDVVRKINTLVARYRGGAQSVANVVIVGGDELMPMARISDLTTDANESSAVSDLLFTTNGLTRGNALFASEFLGNTLTDDAYTAGTTIPWFGRELYLPQLAGGRLVETPADITRQLDAFDASNGILDPGTGVVAGYDFMRDEATQVKTELGSRHTVGGTALALDSSNPLLTNGAPFISPLDSWGQTDVQPYFASSALTPGILSVNGHYNHWELAPAKTPISTATLVPSSLLPSVARFANAILFTMGCHAGLNVSDSFPSTADTAVRLRDWAQALAQNGAGVYVANTGYGYGDYDTIALSERLMTMFAHNLASDGSIGRKLVLAKQQYFASIASYDPYAEKALAEATFYGLPFYRIGTGPDPAPAPLLTPAPTTTPNVAAAPISFSFTGTNALVPHSTARGKYWSAADGGIEYLKDRPIEPRVSQEVTAVGTQRAHGVLIDALQTHDVPGNIDPLIATPMIDLAAHEPESKVTDVTFPATFATLNHWTAFGQNHDQLVVVPGQTREGVTQRLVDSMDVRVLYSNSTDFTAPLFTQVGSVVNGSTATLFARTSDPSGLPLVRAYFTQGGNSWTFVTLTQQGTSDLYVGTATGITVPKLESAFLAEDGAGNVGYTTDKGFLFISQNGDGRGPQVTIAAPIDNGVFTLGQAVPASFSCFDDGGVTSCVGTRPNGQNVDTSTLGPKTFTVTSTDLSGNTTTATAKYTVTYKFDGFFQPVDNLPSLNQVNGGQAVPVKFSLNGDQGLAIFAPGSPSSAAIPCDAAAPVDVIEQTLTNTTSGLNYGGGQYNYVWKTEKSWGGSCRQLTLVFKDGTVHTAHFKFK